MKLIKLEELYKRYQKEFNKTGNHPHPAELLSLLLLPEKEKYYIPNGENANFYITHGQAINEKIEQVIIDFAITKNEIINYITKARTSYREESYERDKIRDVFSTGFGVVLWGNMNHPDWSPERIYNSFSVCWGRKRIPNYLIEDESKETGKTKKRAPRSTN